MFALTCQVRFVVMNNVFRTDLDLHRKFDLKGSTYGRTAGPKPGATGEAGVVWMSQGTANCLRGHPSWGGQLCWRLCRQEACRQGKTERLLWHCSDPPQAFSRNLCQRAVSHLPCAMLSRSLFRADSPLQPSARTWTWMWRFAATPRPAHGEHAVPCVCAAALGVSPTPCWLPGAPRGWQGLPIEPCWPAWDRLLLAGGHSPCI